MKIGLVAGELSGDTLGADLIKSLQTLYPDAEFIGIGGDKMIKAGLKSWYPMDKLSLMGLEEIFTKLPELISMQRQTSRRFLSESVDVMIGIDAPDFTLKIERYLKQHDVPVLHYVSPSVWAWRSYRVKKIKKSTDCVLTLFPFEKQFYDRHGIAAKYVGHTAVKRAEALSKPVARKRLSVKENATVLAVLPGSRSAEIKMLCPLFAEALLIILEANPYLELLVPVAKPSLRADIERNFTDVPRVTYTDGLADEVLAAADYALLASGTAALEAMLFETPMVVAYRMSLLSYSLFNFFRSVDHVALPNHLTPVPLVAELLQDEATPDAIADAVNELIQNPELAEQQSQAFVQARAQLALNSSQLAAEQIRDLLIDRNTRVST